MKELKTGDIIKYKKYDIYYIGHYKNPTGIDTDVGTCLVTVGPWNECLEADPKNYSPEMHRFYEESKGIRDGFWYPKVEHMRFDNYLSIYKLIAENVESYGADYARVWLGSPGDTNYACYISSGGVLYSGNRNYSFAVAPAFSLKKSFIEDTIKSKEQKRKEIFSCLSF